MIDGTLGVSKSESSTPCQTAKHRICVGKERACVGAWMMRIQCVRIGMKCAADFRAVSGFRFDLVAAENKSALIATAWDRIDVLLFLCGSCSRGRDRGIFNFQKFIFYRIRNEQFYVLFSHN